MKTFFKIIIFLFINNVFAQDFVYKPKNPNFGGDTFNYAWLMSSAESQNTFEDPEKNNFRNEKSITDQFIDNLNNQLLSQITKGLFQEGFGGNEGLQPGTYTYGSLSVDIFQSNLGLVINVLDITTGDESQIIIPKR